MRFVFVHFLILTMVFGFPSVIAASAGDAMDWKWIWEGGEKKWRPQLELTARPGNHSIYGMEIDPFLVLGQDGESLAFINVKNNLFWEEGDFSRETNIGGGYRHLMGDDMSWILGGYGYFDMMNSRYNNTFYQGTLGLEALAWNWEARANGYIADDDTKFAPEAGGGGARLTGTTITMGKVIEQAMSGFDAEVGWRLPFFGEDGILSDTRIYAGGFWFNSDDVDSFGGPMTRFETRIWDLPFLMEGSRLVLGTEYRWDDQRNHQVTGLIALRVPIGRSTAPRPLTKVERRMTDRVVRDVSIVADTAVSGSEQVRTRTGAVLEDVVYFANDAESDGTFDDPYDIQTAIDYSGGASGTAENNLLIGLNRNGDIDISGGPLELYDGQTVLGGGTSLWVWGVDTGQAAVFTAPGRAATLCCSGGTFQLANYNTIAGLNFRSQGTALLIDESEGSTMFDIYNNHFWNMGEGLRIEASGDATIHGYMWDNTFTDMGRALEVNANEQFDIGIDFYQNHMEDIGTGIQANLSPSSNDGASHWTLNAYENFFKDLGEETGISIDANISGTQNYTHTSNIHDNEFVDNNGDDIHITIDGQNSDNGDVTVDITIADNTSEDGYGFADIDINNLYNDSHVDLAFLRNEVQHVHEADAIDVDMQYVSGVNVSAVDNRIEKVHDGDGVNIHLKYAGDDEGVNVELLGNFVADVNDDGLYVNVEDSHDTNVTADDNVVKDVNNGNGIRIKLARTGDIEMMTNTIRVAGNDLDDINENRAIAIQTEDTRGPLTIDVLDNEVDDVTGDSVGIQVKVASNDDELAIDVTGNKVDTTGDDGIQIEVDDSGDATVVVNNNEVENADGDGININLDGVGDDEGNTIEISGNKLDTLDDDGIDVEVRNGADIEINITDNTVEHADDDGLDIEIRGNGHDVDDILNITGNTINDTGDDGMEIDVRGYYYEGDFYGNYDTFVTIANNNISDSGNDSDESGADAIDVDFRGVGHDQGNTIDITGNTIDDADDNGIEVDVFAAYYDGEYYGSFDTDVTITGNNVTNTGDGATDDEGDGFYAYDEEEAIGVRIARSGHDTGNTITIEGNTVDRTQHEGISAEVYYAYDTEIEINNNNVNDAEDDLIDVEVYGDGHTEGSHHVNISGNTLSDAQDDGIDVTVGNDNFGDDSGSDDIEITIANNNISETDSNAIVVELTEDTDDAEVDITGNTTNEAGNNGIAFRADSGSDRADVTIANNNITDSGGIPDPDDFDNEQNGVSIDLDDGVEETDVTIDGNNIADSQRNGIDATLNGNDDDGNTLTVTNNNISDSSRYGIEVVSDDELILTGSPANNNVTNSGLSDCNLIGIGSGTITVNGIAVPPPESC